MLDLTVPGGGPDNHGQLPRDVDASLCSRFQPPARGQRHVAWPGRGARAAAPCTMRFVAIVPDSKDWTWVLQRPCQECGFDTQSFPRAAVADLTRDCARRWQEVLTGPGDVRSRPSPDVWSPLEYGCHVRDVFRLFGYRLDLMLTQDGPRYPNWDQDETAIAERYAEQDPAAVAAELAEAGEAIAARFDAVADDQWPRTGYRSDGAEFSVESFARYFIHDPIHHLHDVASAR